MPLSINVHIKAFAYFFFKLNKSWPQLKKNGYQIKVESTENGYHQIIKKIKVERTENEPNKSAELNASKLDIQTTTTTCKSTCIIWEKKLYNNAAVSSIKKCTDKIKKMAKS